MRRGHFEVLRPVCPVCRQESNDGHRLRLAHVERENEAHIVEGAIVCSNPNCQHEFPIIDGIPILIANLRQYVSDNFLAIYGRRDLSDYVESILGDCCGPNSAFDQTRQHLSSYAWDHYADLDPRPSPPAPQAPGAVLRLLGAGWRLAAETVADDGRAGSPLPANSGPALDLGCSVGRSTFALAAASGRLTLGVDLNFAMLRVAAGVLREGIVSYPLRRLGLVYDCREFPVRLPASEAVDFWACDAARLPFPAATFATATALNLLDCVGSPRDLLVSVGRVLRVGGKAILSCPYDWSPAAAPVEAWLGGHSQRSPLCGSPEAVLRALLTPGAHAGSINTLKLITERDDLKWQVRLHARSAMTYNVHTAVAERVAP